MKRGISYILLLAFGGFGLLRAAGPPNFSGRYALILTDPSTAEFSRSRANTPQVVENHRQQLRVAQAALRAELARRNYTVTGSVQTLLNAVFVAATPAQVAELRSLPGVLAVRPLRRFHLNLDQAVKLINANPTGWNAVGGVGNAGLGVKIAIIDTGIDQTHPAFQDNSLTIPSGFPKCNVQSDCTNFTNNKVIVARSYVQELAAGSGPNPAVNSLPDDYSARDRVGHGTAVAMCAAGKTNSGPSDTITGVAPKAYLGSYKIFGSSEINGGATSDVIISALEDAFNDGMDIASLSLGGPAFYGPLDTGATCGEPAGTPCDPEATAFQNAVSEGMMVVAAAGNESQNGYLYNETGAITLNTIDSPGDAPAAIAAAGVSNAHTWVQAVRVSGNVPADIQNISGQFSEDGPAPSAPLTAPLVDVTTVSPDPLGCTSYTGSLNSDLVLVERGTCDFSVKVLNAQNVGAVGVIVYDPAANTTDVPSGLGTTLIPMILIGDTGGLALKSFIDAHSGYPVTIDPTIPVASTPNIVTDFSSRGPSIDGGLKPDVAAVGLDLYMAAESYDPTGELYSPNRYIVAAGTSFATPQVSGAVALVKQAHPNFTPAELKSAVVNTGAQTIYEDDGSTASVLSAGGGLLNVGAAIASNVAAAPATVSFGYLDVTGFPANQVLTITNTASSTVNLTLKVVQSPSTPDGNAHVEVSKNALSLGAGQSANVTATVAGSMPNPGEYGGFITISGGARTLQIPYLYILGDGVVANVTPLISLSDFDCTVGQQLPEGGIAFQVIDDFGEPVVGAPISWSVTGGNGSISNNPNLTDTTTEQPTGIGYNPTPICGSTAGPQEFTASVGGIQMVFDGVARINPTISSHGAVNAADFQVQPGAVPGSYIALFGTGLSDPGNIDVADFLSAPYLPLAIDYVSVSFDVPSAGISLPGLLYYVSPSQINLQVPWELQGQSSVYIKVTVEDSFGSVYTLPLAPYAPAFFDYVESSSKKTLVMALNASGNLIGSSNPATRGQLVHLYANGLGPVNNPPADGQITPASPQSTTTTTPAVTIGGQSATVQFSGLAAGAVGLYELIVQVPSGISTGLQPAVVSINGIASPTISLPVQ
jgi:minor extracellular serine protease Vpr